MRLPLVLGQEGDAVTGHHCAQWLHTLGLTLNPKP